ncbi:RibD family protein [Virgibacillus necropolis]|uniref:RibD family protein n=1 Tax=Virgibacillus necropolis TaxID=163877 RepID=UPI00384B1E9A
MNRKPKVIVNVFSSIDGRITTAPEHNVMEWTAKDIDGGANEFTHQLFDELDCDGMVSGSESLMVWSNDWVDMEKAIYQPKKSKAYIVFDGKGRMNWNQTEGLLVVTKENVNDHYVEQLKGKGISYIQAGKGDHIDLQLALQKLYDRGFKRIGLSGGGSINGAFLRAGLIDEISLVIAPIAIGGKVTPTVFDCDDLTSLAGATKLKLLDTKPLGKDGAIWLHYGVE